MLISFSWTKDPLIVGAKTETRRYWKATHAEKFTAGKIVDAYDKLPYVGGKNIGRIKILKDAYQQKTGQMTEENYKKEGLLWMEKNKKLIKGEKPRKFFDEWRNKDEQVYVLEFEVLEIIEPNKDPAQRKII